MPNTANLLPIMAVAPHNFHPTTVNKGPQVGRNMELRVIHEAKNELEVEVLGENETLLNPIKQALLRDKDVEFAEYIIEHPILSIPKIFVRTKGNTKPQTVLKRTIKEVTGQFDEFETKFVAALKKQ